MLRRVDKPDAMTLLREKGLTGSHRLQNTAIPAEQMHCPAQGSRRGVRIKKKRILTKTPECDVGRLSG